MPSFDDVSQRVRAVLSRLGPDPARTHDNWMMIAREADLVFASWAVAPDVIRPLVPAMLELDTFDEQAWVTVEALTMSTVRVRWLPTPLLSIDMPEIAVRTYVRFRGQRAIYFLSLECPPPFGSTLAQYLFKMPFHDAAVTVTVNGDNYHAESFRTRRGEPPVQFSVHGRIAGPPESVQAGGVDEFLLRQTCMFTVGSASDLHRADVTHRTSAVQPFVGMIDVNTLLPACGVPLPATPPRLRYYAGEDAMVWPTVRVETD